MGAHANGCDTRRTLTAAHAVSCYCGCHSQVGELASAQSRPRQLYNTPVVGPDRGLASSSSSSRPDSSWLELVFLGSRRSRDSRAREHQIARAAAARKLSAVCCCWSRLQSDDKTCSQLDWLASGAGRKPALSARRKSPPCGCSCDRRWAHCEPIGFQRIASWPARRRRRCCRL